MFSVVALLEMRLTFATRGTTFLGRATRVVVSCARSRQTREQRRKPPTTGVLSYGSQCPDVTSDNKYYDKSCVMTPKWSSRWPQDMNGIHRQVRRFLTSSQHGRSMYGDRAAQSGVQNRALTSSQSHPLCAPRLGCSRCLLPQTQQAPHPLAPSSILTFLSPSWGCMLSLLYEQSEASSSARANTMASAPRANSNMERLRTGAAIEHASTAVGESHKQKRRSRRMRMSVQEEMAPGMLRSPASIVHERV